MIIIDNATVSVVATYDEPTLNQDGTALADLAATEVEYRLGNSAVEVLEPIQAASSPTGGGHVSKTFILPAPAGQLTKFTFNVFAIDASGLKSPVSADVVFTVDRVAPAAPSGFSIA